MILIGKVIAENEDGVNQEYEVKGDVRYGHYYSYVEVEDDVMDTEEALEEITGEEYRWVDDEDVFAPESEIEECEYCGADYIEGDEHRVNVWDGSDYVMQCVCESCYNDEVFICERCDEPFIGGTWDEDGDFFCHECYTEGINCYHSDNRPRVSPVGDGLLFGMELEVENSGCMHQHELGEKATELREMLGDYLLNIEDDCTLEDGFEIIFQPINHKLLLQRDWKKLMDSLIDDNFDDNSHAGIHIHMCKEWFGDDDELDIAMAKIIYLASKYWNEFMRFGGRWSDHYCQNYYRRAGHNYKDAQQIASSPAKRHGDYEHYSFLNKRSETIEYRLFQTTYSPDGIRAYIMFLDNLCHIGKNCRMRQVRKMSFEDILKYNKEYSDKLTKYWEAM